MTRAGLKVPEPLDALPSTYCDTTSVIIIIVFVEIHALARYSES